MTPTSAGTYTYQESSGTRGMGRNPIEDSFLASFFLGLGVLFAMAIVGEAIGTLFLDLGVPYARWVGVSVGIIVVFVAFVVLYRRYDSRHSV